jgi:hypothetical protein
LAGVMFSGHGHNERTGESSCGAAGLNPDPAPFRTRLEPRESSETPVVFVGGFAMEGMEPEILCANGCARCSERNFR